MPENETLDGGRNADTHRADLGACGGAAFALAAWSASVAAPTPVPRFADNRPNAIPVDTELVIAVDVSYSMDPEEQELQRQGYITGADLARIHVRAQAAYTARSP